MIINICQHCSLTPVNALVMPHSTAQVPMYKEGLIGKKKKLSICFINEYCLWFQVPGNFVQDLDV